MNYYEEMRTKWAFNDGDSMPPFIDLYRKVYIEAINRVAKEFGSKVEAFPYDRPGMHNWCLLLYRKIGEDDQAAGWREADHDEPMDRALLICFELGLDSLVQINASLPEDWKSRLEDMIVNSKEIEP